RGMAGYRPGVAAAGSAGPGIPKRPILPRSVRTNRPDAPQESASGKKLGEPERGESDRSTVPREWSVHGAPVRSTADGFLPLTEANPVPVPGLPPRRQYPEQGTRQTPCAAWDENPGWP